MNRAQQHARNRDDWETPPEFFAKVNEYFRFDFDGAASDGNHLCDRWTQNIQQDGWPVGWVTIWCNPPYSDKAPFLRLAASGTRRSVCMLLPASTDTAWFHDLVAPNASQLAFIRGRLQFLLGGKRPVNSGGKLTGNTGGSLLAVFGEPLLGVGPWWIAK